VTRKLIESKMHTGRRYRWHVAWEHKWPDAWVGAFWTTTRGAAWVLDLWVCIVPFLPVHVFIQRQPPSITNGNPDWGR
jgi:hypothetical protein